MIKQIDLSHPESFRDGFPHEYFRALRREAPVFWNEGEYVPPELPIEPGPCFWVLSK